MHDGRSIDLHILSVAVVPAPLDDRAVIVLPHHDIRNIDVAVVELHRVVIRMEERALHRRTGVQLHSIGLPVPGSHLLVVTNALTEGLLVRPLNCTVTGHGLGKLSIAHAALFGVSRTETIFHEGVV